MEGFSQKKWGRRLLGRNRLASALILFGKFSLPVVATIALSGCVNDNGRSAGTTETATSVPKTGLGGGVLPVGASFNAITLINASPSASSTNGTELDVIGQNDEIGDYCPTLTACVCRIEFTPAGSTSPTAEEVSPSLVEVNMLRCSYDVVPSTATSFQLSIRAISGGAQSNRLTVTMPRVESSKDTNNSNNYVKVSRFQCKDIVQKTTNWYRGGSTSLLDPQSWNMSLSFNFYTTSMGRDYAGATANFECPVNPTDDRVVQYSQDRYWPYLGYNQSGSVGQAVGPKGIDERCGTVSVSSGAASCDCPGGSTNGTTSIFDGQGNSSCTTNKYTPGMEYNSRANNFGVSSGAGTTRGSTNGLLENEPYDMAIYSAKPLKGYDNVIFPVDIDRGSKTTFGVNNEKNINADSWANNTSPSFNCTDGKDPDLCKCITGTEAECRKFQANRHDFYVANFLDGTFKTPFCVPHTPGGPNQTNSITNSLDCAVDTSQSPAVLGKDVMGFVALPDGAGQCPNITLPRGKKWGLLWQFSATFPVRRVIDVANPDDIGDLFCTSTQKECTGTSQSWIEGDGLAAITNHQTTPTTTTHGNGPKYCQSGLGRGTGTPLIGTDYNVGVIGPYPSAQGTRFGNCLQIGSGTGAPNLNSYDTAIWGDSSVTRGICQWTDGFTPFQLPNNALNNVGGSFRLMSGAGGGVTDPQDPHLPANVDANGVIADTGCYAPSVTYFQSHFNLDLNTLLSGFFNYYSASTSKGCMAWDNLTLGDAKTRRGFFSGFNFPTFDWQGFPFVAGNYTSVPAGFTSDQAGVGMGGNYCNPTLPGSRWSGPKDTSYDWNVAPLNATMGDGATLDRRPGYNDGIDVWLIGNGAKNACIEADIDNTYGFLYNIFATVDHTSASGPRQADNYVNRLPGTNASNGASTGVFGFPGLVELFPKTIKNWFDFVGIGCSGACDNSSAANSYPKFPWEVGQHFNRGANAGTADGVYNSTSVPAAAIRSGKHSSTDSWGGYGVFQFTTVDLESVGRTDRLYVVTPTGLTRTRMEDPDTGLQYTPVRYINGSKIIYSLDGNSQNVSNPTLRLPSFPMCVLQDNGDGG